MGSTKVRFTELIRINCFKGATTLSIMILSIKPYFATLSITICHYDECHMMSVTMLSVTMLNVTMLSVTMPSVALYLLLR